MGYKKEEKVGSKYDRFEFRKEVFEKFLRVKFEKEPEKITKEDLLALSQKHFEETRIKVEGSPISLLNWHSRRNKTEGTKKNAIFSVLDDLGYAKKHRITEKEVIDEARKKTGEGVAIFNDKENRQKVFEAMLKKIYGEKEITKEDLLALGKKEFEETKIEEKGSPISLLNWHMKRNTKGGKKSSVFSVFEDLGYAKKYMITEKDVVAAAKKRVLDGSLIFDDRKNRERVFRATLEKIYGEKKIIKEDLLALGWTQFYRTTTIDGEGTPHGLYKYYQRKNRAEKNTQNIGFFILKDLGYCEKFDITEDDYAIALSQKRSERTGKRIVIIDEKRMGMPTDTELRLPEKLFAVSVGDTKDIQVVMATTRTENGAEETAVGQSQATGGTLFEQAVQKQYGNIEIVNATTAYLRLKEGKVGEELLIASNIQFDEIYTRGIELLGYAFLTDKNMLFRTNDSDVNRTLGNKHFTVVRRLVEKDEASKLMFENQLYPARAALHVLAGYARLAGSAQNQPELWHAVDKAMDWMIFMRNNAILSEKEFTYFGEKYLLKIGRIENRKMKELGFSKKYDLDEVRNGVFAGIAIKKMERGWGKNQNIVKTAGKRLEIGKV